MAVLLMAAALLGVGLLVFWVEPLSVLSAIERFTPNIIYRLRTHRPVVALSFDDGPHPTFTLEVLERFFIGTTPRQLSSSSANEPCATPKWFPKSKLRDTRLAITTSEMDRLWGTLMPTSLIT